MLTAASAGEAFLVPGVSLVGHAAATNNLGALAAALGVLGLVAGHADNLVFAGNEALGANRLLALHTDEALLVPLLASVLVLAHTGLENTLATVATGGEALIVAV